MGTHQRTTLTTLNKTLKEEIIFILTRGGKCPFILTQNLLNLIKDFPLNNRRMVAKKDLTSKLIFIIIY